MNTVIFDFGVDDSFVLLNAPRHSNPSRSRQHVRLICMIMISVILDDGADDIFVFFDVMKQAKEAHQLEVCKFEFINPSDAFAMLGGVM